MIEYWKNGLTHYEGHVSNFLFQFGRARYGWAEFALFESELCLLRLQTLPSALKVQIAIGSDVDRLLAEINVLRDLMFKLEKSHLWIDGDEACVKLLDKLEQCFREVHELWLKAIDVVNK